MDQRRAEATYAARNPEKRRALQLVNDAVKCRRLQREPCLFCGAEKVEAHHHDYTLPLVVTWLCRRHHKIVHRKMVRATHCSYGHPMSGDNLYETPGTRQRQCRVCMRRRMAEFNARKAARYGPK